MLAAIQEKQRYTVADYEVFIALPEHEDRRFELIDGEIIEVSPKLRHGLATGGLFAAIYMWLKEHPIGIVAVEVDHQMPDDPNNTRRPDISYISNERLQDADPDETLPFMPDLAVEIKSPSNSVKGIRGLREKALYYLENGSRLVWLIYPDRKSAEACSRSADGAIQFVPLGKDDPLDGGDVLPGFSIALSEVLGER